MATTNLYLKEPESDDETTINLVYFCEAFRLKISTGEKIKPAQWNDKTQRAKKSYEDYSNFNSFLDSVVEKAGQLRRAILTEGRTVTSDEMREGLSHFLGSQRKQTPKEFFEALDEFSDIKKGKLSVNYLKSIKTLKNHLTAFQKSKKYKITFERVNLAFYELFTSYLYNNCGQTNNTVGTNISRLKHFLKWAGKMGYNQFTNYKEREFKAMETETDSIYLTEDELYSLLNLELEPNSKLYNIRESFCFGCFTGLRFSDIAKIKKENVSEDELIFTTQKTRDSLTVPLSEDALSILERNDFRLPVISNQKSNEYLKELGKKAKIKDKVQTIRFKGSERIEEVKDKFELITTHTARRTFITLSLEKGMRAELVMAITGHKSYQNFKKYIKLTDKVKKGELKRIWNKPKEQILQVV